MSFIPLLAIKTFFSTFLDFWNRLPAPIKIIIIGLIVAFFSFKMGEHRAYRICEAQKQESIQEAKRIDSEANASAIKRMQEQTDKYRNQALESENKLNEAKEYYATLPAFCKIDDDFVERNNAIGSGDGVQPEVPGHKPGPAKRK